MSAPVLVIAPHALDEVLGCGGTMARAAQSGSTVHLLVLCGDGTGIDGKRREAATGAALLLGTKPPRFCGFPENRTDTVPLGDVVASVEAAVAEIRPETVYVSHGGNLNIDHQTAYRATATALRPVSSSPATAFYAYEIASSTDWAPPGFGQPFRPTHFVDIAPVLDLKMKALALYAFDMRQEPHARSIRALKNLARRRGASVGLAAAEAFAAERTLLRSQA